MSNSTEVCRSRSNEDPLHLSLVVSFECSCGVNKKTRELVRVANLQYQKATNALIDSGIYDTSDDFTVVRQPFMEDMEVPLMVALVSA